MFSSKKETKNINFFNKFFTSPKKKRAVFFVLALSLLITFSLSQKCLAYTYTQDQINQLKNSSQGKWWDDSALAAAQKTYSWDQLQSLQKSLYDYNIINDARGGLTPQQALDANLQQKATQGSDVGGQVNTQGENLLVTALLGVVIGVLSIIVYFLKFLVSWSGALVDLALNPSLYNFTSNAMIVQGWTVVRDVCNLFFLLVLLFIALCTILKIEKYHAKKTLLMLIIMALLINFSKPIAIFIFDGSQLLMNFFLSQLNGNQQSASTMYTGAAKIADSIYTNIPKYFGSRLGSPEIALVYLFSTIFLFILAVAYLVTAIFLIIRIVVIMMLIIVSPFAFFAAIIPDFSKMSSQWWSSLFEYSYYGPAAAFFLLLATKLQNSLPDLGKVNMGGDQGVSLIVSNMIQYLVVIIFLYASIFMAKKFGGGAGAAIVGNANRFMKWAGTGAYKAPYRATAGTLRATGVTGGVQQRIAASRLGKYLTKGGRKNAQEEREAAMAERFGVKGAKDKFALKKMAEKTKQWKDQGILDDEIKLREQLKNGDKTDKMVAARELAKAGKLKDGSDYKAGLDALASSPALLKTFKDDAKKKNIHAVIDEEITRTSAAGHQAVYDNHLNSIKPAELGDQNLDAFRVAPGGPFKAEFANWANGNLTTTHTGIKNDLAKKLNAKDLADFTTNNWV